MASIVWAVVCHRAFLDENGRISLHGLIDMLTVPELPIHVREITIVAKLDDRPLITELALRIEVLRPGGLGRVAEDDYGMELIVAGHYVVARMARLPVVDLGVHRFEVSVAGQPPAAVEIPVFSQVDQLERVH